MASSEPAFARENPSERRSNQSAPRPSLKASADLDVPYLFRLSLEMVALFAAWYLAAEIRLLANPHMSLQFTRAELRMAAPPPGILLLLWIGVEVWLSGFRRTSSSKVGTQSFGPAETMLVVMGIAILGTFFSRQLGAPLSRSFIILLAPVGFAMLQIAYLVEQEVWRAAVKKWPQLLKKIALLCRPADVEHMLSQLQLADHSSFQFCGMILPLAEHEEDTPPSVRCLGRVGDLAEIVNREALNQVIVARNGFTVAELRHCSRVSKRMGIMMSREIDRADDDVEVYFNTLHGMHLLDLRPVRFTRGLEITRRFCDIVGAAVLLLLVSPILVLAAILTWGTSKGPIFYRSQRVGQGGRYFTFLKFRTMYVDGKRREDVAHQNERAGHLFKIRNDPRVTPVGRVLRRYSIDELPQLINVLMGSMSLIGPRPLPAGDLDPDGMSQTFTLWAEKRALVRPGITGLWQVNGRSDLGFPEMMTLDLEYIQNRSVWLDVKILLATPLAVLTARGAY